MKRDPQVPPYRPFSTTSNTDSPMNSLVLRFETPGLLAYRVARKSIIPSRPVRCVSEVILTKNS
jgi:hypothetical protein